MCVFCKRYLPVGENCSIVSLKATFDKLVDAGAVNRLLLDVYVEHKVVGEGLVFTQQHLGLAGGYGGADVAALDLLLRHLRTNPARKIDMYRDYHFTSANKKISVWFVFL